MGEQRSRDRESDGEEAKERSGGGRPASISLLHLVQNHGEVVYRR